MKKLHYLIIAMLLGFCLNAQVFVTGGGVGGWDPNGRVFLTSTDGINYSSTADFEVTGPLKIGEAPGWQTIWGYDSSLGSGWPGGTLPSTCGDCGTDISPSANGWYSVTYNINTNEYLFSPGINPFGPYPTFAPATPLTFEEPQTTIYYKYEDFGNNTGSDPKGGLSKIANPHKEGINTSNTVFQMIKRGASWSGSKFFTAPAIDFSTSSKIIKIKIWSPRVGAKLKLKFEGGGGDDQVEVESTVANAWEELIFDFSSKTMGTSRTEIVFQFEDGLNDGYDPNTPAQSNVADYTWLIDDISIVIAPPTAASQTFCTSQSATVNNLVATGTALKWYAAASGGSALASNVTLVEGTYYVSQTVGGNESPRTSVAVTVISNTGVNISACGTSYTWPLSGLTYTESGNYEYTFGSCVTMLNLTLTPITYNTTVVSAENPYTWSNNGQVYATSGIKTGTTTNCVTELLNLTITNPVVHVTGGGVGGWDPNGKVFLTSTDGINYSSTASFEVTGDMKIGEATGFQNIWGYDETLGSGWPGGTLPNNCGDCGKNISPAANGWYNVTYNRNTKVYLFTEGINPYGPYPTLAPSTPLTFEEPQTTIYYKFEDFGNETNQGDPKGGLTKIANPHKEGINTSNTVFQMIKRGASWSGSKFFTTPAIDFSASSNIVKVKIWSPRVGTVLKLKFEGDGDDQLEVASTVANAWEELIFDFSAKTMGTTRNQIAFQFEDGNDGYDPNTPARSNVADYTWLIDDISIVIAPPTAASQTFCSSASATVNDLVATGIALKWYAAASGGSALASNEALVEGTYYVSQTVGGNESPRTSVAVTIISNTPVTESACGTSYTWPLNGVTYTASGTYSYTSGSCSTTLNLTLTPITYNTTVVSAENPYTWSNNGQVYATSGIKTGTTTNCVTELLNLTITNPVVHVTGGGVGGWDPNGKVFLTSTDGINYSSTASFEITGEVKIGEATGYQNIWGYDETLGSGWPGGTLPNNCGDCGKNISPAANGWYNVTYNRNTKVYLFTEGINPYGPYPTLAPSTPMTFEEPQTTIYYKTEDYGNETNQGDPKGGLTKIANPHKEGINTSNTVFQMIKRGWASWTGSKFFTTSPIDFSVSTKVLKVKIWSPRVGTSLKLKFTGGDGDNALTVASTVANAWEELIFDFSAVTMGTSRSFIEFQFEEGLDNGYDPNTPARSNVADYTWLIDDISLTQIPATFPGFCKGATIASATGSTSLKFYTSTSVTAAAVTSTTALATKTYYVTETIGGVESSPRVARAIVVNNLPATPSALASLEAKNICKYIGSDTPVTFTATATGASSYIWTAPTGATIDPDGGQAFISFEDVSTVAGPIGSVTVKIVDANGCISAPKALALTTTVPKAPTSLTLTSANSTPHFNGIITPAVIDPPTPAVTGLVGLNSLVKITKVGPYMGTGTVFTLTAAEASTAASYVWTLPTGVNQLSGGNSNVITVDFADVEPGIGALPIVVQSVGGCGNSINRTLTLARALPTAPTKLVLTDDAISTITAVTKVGPYTGKSTELTLTATPFATQGGTATSYAWILPAGVNCETSNTPTTVKVKSTVNTGTVEAPIYAINDVAAIATASSTITINLDDVQSGVTALPIQVFGVNGAGNSIARTLALTAAVPATPAIVGSLGTGSATQFSSCATKTYTATLIPGATYAWTLPSGATIVGAQDGNVIVVDYSNTTVAIGASGAAVTCTAINGTGPSVTKSLTVKRVVCPAPVKIAPEAATTEKFSAVAYPNPATEGFRVKSSNGKSFGVQVYDLLGRSIEQRQMSSDAQIGSNYAKGIYNVIVNQGANVKTLRVIKQ